MPKIHLLSAAVFTALVLSPAAHAADAAGAVSADASASPATVQQLDAVSVIGQGETRQVQRITQQDIPVLPPGTSIQKLLNRMPGVNVQSNDAFGANEESQTISLRGFNGTRLGYTLDGLPLGDNAYGNYNGLNISRALIAENFGGVELASGIGALGTASTSNLGGTIQYYSADPSSVFGGQVSQTVGSDANRRTFLRVDTGDYNGFSAYLSGINAEADMWARPESPTTTRQFNAKGVYQFDGGKLTAFADTSRTSQADYSYLSKSGMARGLGWDWNLYAPDWNRALAAAYCAPATRNAARCGFSGGVDNIDDAYYQSRALRDDDLFYVAGDFQPNDAISLHTQVYHHENKGQGHWWSPGQASNPGTPQALPISIRSTNYWINRTGGIASLGWDLGPHHLEAGLWYERNHHDVERNFYWITGPVSDDKFLQNPNRRLFSQNYVITTRQFYVQGNFKFLDERLSLDLGIKSPSTEMTARETPGVAVEAPVATGSLKASESVLPQIGLGYRVAEGQELFASYAENIAAFQGGGAGGPLLVTQASFDASVGALEPEKSRTLEAGYRFVRDRFEASLVGYDVTFDNRLLSLNPCASIQQGTTPACTTRFFNVGSVSSRGGELTVIWKPTSYLQWYNSASINRSTYDDNYVQNGVTIPTAGKTTVDTPKRMFASEIAFNYANWNVNLRGKYTGERFYTYTNDQGFGGYTSFDAGAGYDFGQVGVLQGLKLSFNVTNLTDKRYASNLTAFANSDPNGRQLAFHASAPRQFFLTLDAKF
ncbi:MULTISPECIES: TonB-dependent receptor [unclassified Xanthomonas]|uniref:TonB-dependent receptor n=1 Tax=unclassified Xanthomonas TaxID=2643310 RepID=UPI000CEF1FD2|nr:MULTISPECIES: TonB-dependent receptor [unclassified Xanthomonas]PPU29595.1 TonB-dependent receptor [Xanthomonas sp. CFBP 7912]RJS02587.1 TonB-dependent receptor [Xanthomonas sp. CFBP 7698]